MTQAETRELTQGSLINVTIGSRVVYAVNRVENGNVIVSSTFEKKTIETQVNAADAIPILLTAEWYDKLNIKPCAEYDKVKYVHQLQSLHYYKTGKKTTLK